MDLSISNLAWDYNENDYIFNNLKQIGINQIECVLTKIDDWSKLDKNKISEYKILLDKYDIKPNSIQSLFYGVKCGSITEENKIIDHFKKLIEYSNILETKILVFGSPNLRKKNNNWEKSLINIFKTLDIILNGTDVIIVIEPNSKIYKGEFFTNIYDIIEFIKKNKFINIKTMIDTHNLFLENDDPIKTIEEYFDYIKHIHISELNLSAIKEKKFHIEFSNKIKKLNYKNIITYEILKCDDIIYEINKFNEIYK